MLRLGVSRDLAAALVPLHPCHRTQRDLLLLFGPQFSHLWHGCNNRSDHMELSRRLVGERPCVQQKLLSSHSAHCPVHRSHMPCVFHHETPSCPPARTLRVGTHQKADICSGLGSATYFSVWLLVTRSYTWWPRSLFSCTSKNTSYLCSHHIQSLILDANFTWISGLLRP